MQVATHFERRQNNTKNDNVVLCKVQNVQCIKLLNALNELFQLGNIAQEWIENRVI